MRCIVAMSLLSVLASEAIASSRARISPAEMAEAINEIANLPGYRYGPLPIRAADVRVLKCIGPDEEPTESECEWQHRSAGKWVRHKSWLAIDGKGWHVID